MASKKKEEQQEKLRFSFDALTDDEIDARIIACLKRAKDETDPRHYNYKWKDEDLNIRNYAIWRLIYKQGKSRVETMRNLVSRWGISQKTAYEYIKMAENEVNATYDETVEEYRSKSLEKAQKLYDYAVEHNQPKVALQALDMINKLNGTYAPESHNVSVSEIKFEFD